MKQDLKVVAPEKQFVVSEKVLQATVNYLSTRPWNEVNAMLTSLLQSKALQTTEEPKGNEKTANA